VREAVFNVLGPMDGLRVLDLFAGSGAMGLEALSRGASHCVFVEGDRRVASILCDNISTLGVSERAFQVIVADYAAALRRLRCPTGFDLLFMDPPYRMLPQVELTLQPFLPALLAPEGVAVVEGRRSTSVDMGLLPVFDRVYGDTRVVMLSTRRNGQ
jgi:16S rRNA (guanine966-N2)-methyltransferase